MPSRKERLARRELKLQARQVVAASYQFQGPIPSPQDLANYDRVVPGLAPALVQQFQEQSRHRMDMERYVTRSETLRSYVGLGAGMIVALAFLAVAGYLIHEGHDIAGTFLGSVDIVALVSVFVIGTNSRRRERLERQQILTGRS